ncbi:polyhomeotic-like protein 2 [Heliangelus exortis]|uniref:polyhomeotic-like protein 2 n=1 Tax=Heliangelus exortis TaxID=472823 RepID=UPI003A9442B4
MARQDVGLEGKIIFLLYLLVVLSCCTLLYHRVKLWCQRSSTVPLLSLEKNGFGGRSIRGVSKVSRYFQLVFLLCWAPGRSGVWGVWGGLLQLLQRARNTLGPAPGSPALSWSLQLHHRVAEVGRELRAHPLQPPAMPRDTSHPAQAAPSLIQPGPEHLQGGSSHSFSGQAVPESQHPPPEELLPQLQAEPLLLHFQTISPSPSTGHSSEKSLCSLPGGSLQGLGGSSKVPLESQHSQLLSLWLGHEECPSRMDTSHLEREPLDEKGRPRNVLLSSTHSLPPHHPLLHQHQTHLSLCPLRCHSPQHLSPGLPAQPGLWVAAPEFPSGGGGEGAPPAPLRPQLLLRGLPGDPSLGTLP